MNEIKFNKTNSIQQNSTDKNENKFSNFKNQKQKKKILGQKEHMKGLNNTIKQPRKNITGIQNQNEQKEIIIQEQNLKINRLEEMTCHIKDKTFRPDLREMLKIFHSKV